MASLQVGRLFADFTVDPQTVQWQGNRLVLAGLVDAGSVDQAKALREQVNAMNGNPDEPFVAVRWAGDSTVDGFYRLLGTSTDPGLMHLSAGWLSWAVELERVTGSQFAPLESHVTWQLATNTHGITTGTFSGGDNTLQWGVPASAFDFGPVSGDVGTMWTGVFVSSSTALGTGFGSLKLVANAAPPAKGILGWSVDPADYYHGNCRVTTDFGTATDQIVLGRRADDSYTWEVSNGLVRFWVDSADDSLRVEHWQFSSSQWRRPNATNYRFTFNGVNVAYDTMTILRNSPESVAVRLGCNTGGSASTFRVYVDLTILRGSQTVYGYISTPVPAGLTLPTLGIVTTANVPSSTVSGGFEATSADVNGMKFAVLTGTPAVTNTLATGRTATTATSATLSFGLNASGVGLVTGIGTLTYNREFFSRRAETTRVVAR